VPRTVLRALGALALLTGATSSLAAQQDRASLELGLSSLSLEGLRPTQSLTVVPTYGRNGMSGAFNVAGAVAVAPEGEWSAQGILSGSRFVASSPFGRYEVGAMVSGVAYGESQGTATSLIQLRNIRGDALEGLWVATGGGIRWRDGTARTVITGDVGTWRSFRALRLTAQLAFSRAYEDTIRQVEIPYLNPSVTSGTPGGGFGTVLQRDFHAVMFGTALLSGSWARGPVSLDATLSSRMPLDDGRTEHAALGSVTYAIDRRMAIVAGGGRQQSDQVLGIPAGTFATLAVRLTASDGELRRAAGGDRGGLVVLPRRGGSRHVLRVEVQGAQRVEIAGDFTGWEPVAMTRRADGWEAALRLHPGSYRIAIRVDGGEWLPPPGLPHVGDELGGVVGMLIVP
jgi:hypothetical protein